jgi:hypothetical protein
LFVARALPAQQTIITFLGRLNPVETQSQALCDRLEPDYYFETYVEHGFQTNNRRFTQLNIATCGAQPKSVLHIVYGYCLMEKMNLNVKPKVSRSNSSAKNNNVY